MHTAYPSFMITIEIHDPEDIEMLHLILERLLQIHCESEEQDLYIYTGLASPIGDMTEGNLLYSGTNSNQYINLARDLSALNSKNEEVSTRDGHVYAYICNITVHSDVTGSYSVFTAPNTWKMRNAFRKWHAYRDMMFSEAGVTDEEKGRYGKTIRPYLDAGMASGVIKTPTGVDLGDWTYSEIAATPGFVESAIGTEGGSIVDVYNLNILGENQVSSTSASGTERYSAVGMIHSYNQDRMEIVTPVAGETVEGQNNPLALLRYKGAAAGELMDIVEEQELEAPPYSIDDNGSSVDMTCKGIATLSVGTASVWDTDAGAQVVNATTIPKTITFRNIVVPAGLLILTTANRADNALVHLECVGKVLCKDLA